MMIMMMTIIITRPSKLCETQIYSTMKYVVDMWKIGFGGKCSVEKFRDKNVVGIFGGNAIFDILEPPAFQKYKIHWVLEPLCLCLCLSPVCLCLFVSLI